MKIITNAVIALIMLTSVVVDVSAQAKQQADIAFDGLKGKAKTVSVEVVDFELAGRNEWVPKPRVPKLVTTYDELGNQTRLEVYSDHGNLEDTRVYSFIGKMRVITSIESPTSTALVLRIPGPKPRRFDPRYTYRVVHRYDAQGRRIQTMIYHNTGQLWLRHVFKFHRNRKTHLLYDRQGLNYKTEFTLDEQGNELNMIETGMYVVADKTVYKYDEFDAQGNWTKRRVYKGIKEIVDDNLFTRAHPWAIEYRVISYY